jgi:hypothetical protein
LRFFAPAMVGMKYTARRMMMMIAVPM